MFDFVGKNKRTAQVILALITLPFAFFGVDSYIRRMGTPDDEVAKVGSDRITRAEFDNALREQQEQMRCMLGKNFDSSMFDTPELRFNIREQLINQRLMRQLAEKNHIVVSEDLIRQYIMDFPAFQADGKLSPDKARGVLASHGMTDSMREYEIRQVLLLQPLLDPFGAVAFVSRTSAI